jgi:DNA repair protein RadD
LAALDTHIRTRDTNPCVVIPTGGGKSVLMAWIIQRWTQEYPQFRVCILAHRKELVLQNSTELASAWPEADVGVYSAGLKRRDANTSILFASIDSIYKKWGEFPGWDCLIVDEAHRIPARGEGK